MAMAGKMVDVTITRLLKISEVFALLEPSKLANILEPVVSKAVFSGWTPRIVLNHFLKSTAAATIKGIERIVDIRELVVTGMTTDPTVLGSFFQKVGKNELKFLVDSGVGIGFLLGLVQMVQWMVLPKNWTLPVGGAIVGTITNWIALKWIFEPLVPTKVGPFIFQGMFLQRQKEVSRDFCTYIAANVLNSQKVWEAILTGPKSAEFAKIVAAKVPLPAAMIAGIIRELQSSICNAPGHPLHLYTNARLNLKDLLIERMNRLTPQEFEQVLHPIFQEDELTLILAGGVLGALAGALQWWANKYFEKKAAAGRAGKGDKGGVPGPDGSSPINPVPQSPSDEDGNATGGFTSTSRNPVLV
jgi:hypothetical protein